MKEQITFNDYEKVDIRIGTVLSVNQNKKARKPSLVIEVDFGQEIGIKKSSAQITDFYNKENLKIVVVEDSNLARKSIIETLENEGFDVVGEAPNAQQAMALIQTSGCNCLVVDVVMPEISGIEFAQALSELKNKVLVIMMSSLKQEDIIIETIAAGAIDFLEKCLL